MEEAAELAGYLPLSFMSRRDGIPWGKTPKEQEYIEFLWDAFETNHTHGKYQQAIVAEIEAEQALVTANRELIARFEQNIQATLARIWGEDAPTSAVASEAI